MKSLKLNMLIAGCILFSFGYVNAQKEKENLAKDFSFFQNKGAEYGSWLDKTGLGKSLAFDKVRMRPLRNKPGIDSTELEMFLLIRTNDADSAIGIWEGLKRGFDNPGDSLENYLYRTFVHIMEFPGEQGSIQVYIKDKNGQYNPCFYVFIWQEKDNRLGQKVMIENHFRGCKAKSFDIKVTPPPVKIQGKGKSTKVIKPKVKKPDQVFEIIRHYAIDSIIGQPRYRTGDCKDRRPHFESDSIRSPYAYKFTLADLGREVLPPSFWFNIIAMERLSFQFEYQQLKDGFNLKCIIEGKYGSGFFKPRVSGYMNMEPDYNDYLDAYTEKVKKELLKRL